MSQSEPRLLPRDQITNILDKAVRTYPLVVLTAPMGYGKTTAARELIRNLGWRVFYITVDPGEHNAFYLWDRACDQLFGQGSSIADSFRRMGFPRDAVQMYRTFTQGKEYLGGRDTLVVIDDYHNANAPEVDKFIEALARERIPGLRLLLVSRYRPDLPLEELRFKGISMNFDKSLLTFSEEDALRYFVLNGIHDEEAAETAWKYTEGWAAALGLSLQSYQASGVLSPVMDVERLLSSTLFPRYEEEEQSLLLQLSILGSFTPRQAACISQDPVAPRRLRALLEQNALMTYDGMTDRYRFHSIFRSFLERMLMEQASAAARAIDQAELYMRAGEWSATEGDMLQAIRYLFKAGTSESYLRILRLFEKPGDGLVVMFDPEGVSRIMQAIPWSIKKLCPIGYLAFIYHDLSRIDRNRGMALLKEARDRFMADSDITPKVKRKIQGEYELIKGIGAFNDLYSMRDQHEIAHKLLDGRSNISHRGLIWTFGCPHVSFLYLRDPGDYGRLIKMIDENLFYYQEMTDGCSFGAQDLFLAEYLLETGNLRKVEAHLMKAAYRATSKEQVASLIATHFTHARLKMAQGQRDNLLAPLLDMLPAVQRGGNPLLADSIDLSLGYIAAVQGKQENIPQWLKDERLANSRGFWQGVVFRQLVLGKSLLVAGNWPVLEALTQDALACFRENQNIFGLIHANCLLAIAMLYQYGAEEAMPFFTAAVETARPDKIQISLAEYAPYLLPLLEQRLERRPEDAFLASLMKMSERYTRRSSTTPWGLTQRQREMLERAVSGESNSVIAKALGIKPVTVGNTLTRIYKKLNVQNRMEAAKLWRQFSPHR